MLCIAVPSQAKLLQLSFLGVCYTLAWMWLARTVTPYSNTKNTLATAYTHLFKINCLLYVVCLLLLLNDVNV